MCQPLQCNFEVIQYLVKNASFEQLTWRQNGDDRSLADVLGKLRDIEMWHASIQLCNGHAPAQRSLPCKCPPANNGSVFESYAFYRRRTLSLLNSLSPASWQAKAQHRLFGVAKLTELVNLMNEYDQIYIHQLEEVIQRMPLNPLYARALYEISVYHRRYKAHLAQATSLLDIGVGSGLALQYVMQQNPHLVCAGVDVRDLRLAHVDAPLQVYDGETLPFLADQFDISLIFYVLHHCYQPERLLAEATRVTRQALIIIEEFNHSGADLASLELTERQSHRALGIPPDLPYALFSQNEFEQMLRARNLAIVQQELLPSQTTRPVEKYLYVVEIIK